MTDIIDEIFALFERFGSERYGEDVSLENHMLQTAAQAEAMAAPDHVVVAALLHDVGHFLHADSRVAVAQGRDLEHEALGAAWLSQAFGDDVTAPIALHVEAKRYLCAVEPEYHAQLSQASRDSLEVQGGVMSSEDASSFAQHPAFEAAVLLRRCDDRGKDAFVQPQPLEHYRALMTSSLRRSP